MSNPDLTVAEGADEEAATTVVSKPARKARTKPSTSSEPTAEALPEGIEVTPFGFTIETF